MFTFSEPDDCLAKLHIETLLKSTYRGTFFYEGYDIKQKRSANKPGESELKRKRTRNEEDLDSDLNEDEVNESGSDGENEENNSEYSYEDESKEDFDRNKIGIIVVENEFFLKKFE